MYFKNFFRFKLFFNRFHFISIFHIRFFFCFAAFPFVFGVAVYCFEGTGMIIPVEDAMLNRENFTPILSVVMLIYTSLCVVSGGLGYLAFGDATEVPIRSSCFLDFPPLRSYYFIYLFCSPYVFFTVFLLMLMLLIFL